MERGWQSFHYLRYQGTRAAQSKRTSTQVRKYIAHSTELSKISRRTAHSKRRSTQVRQYRRHNYITLHGSYTAQLHSKVVIQISGHMPSWLVVGLKKYIGINPTQRQNLQIPWEWIKKLWFLRRFIQIYSANQRQVLFWIPKCLICPDTRCLLLHNLILIVDLELLSPSHHW